MDRFVSASRIAAAGTPRPRRGQPADAMGHRRRPLHRLAILLAAKDLIPAGVRSAVRPFPGRPVVAHFRRGGSAVVPTWIEEKPGWGETCPVPGIRRECGRIVGERGHGVDASTRGPGGSGARFAPDRKG